MHRRVLMALFIFALLIGVGWRLLPDRLERRMKALAGPGAIDCSDYRVPDAEVCMNQAYAQGKAFYGRRDSLPDWVKGSVGVVCRRKGTATYIHQNSAMPQGYEEVMVISRWSSRYSWLP
ncbi:MAG: hypothetical protein NTX57_06170 [Armatimonadetes bacterium]|nr:hypothetical protein [Armatimonadota bacterium]